MIGTACLSVLTPDADNIANKVMSVNSQAAIPTNSVSGWPSRGTPRVAVVLCGGSVRGDPVGVVPVGLPRTVTTRVAVTLQATSASPVIGGGRGAIWAPPGEGSRNVRLRDQPAAGERPHRDNRPHAALAPLSRAMREGERARG
jgi:hypothetical protein